jgi:hypothetical protein
VKCLEEELFRQGDQERNNGLPISPLMDRHKAGITKSQTGFFDIVALPMYQSFVQVRGRRQGGGWWVGVQGQAGGWVPLMASSGVQDSAGRVRGLRGAHLQLYSKHA